MKFLHYLWKKQNPDLNRIYVRVLVVNKSENNNEEQLKLWLHSNTKQNKIPEIRQHPSFYPSELVFALLIINFSVQPGYHEAAHLTGHSSFYLENMSGMQQPERILSYQSWAAELISSSSKHFNQSHKEASDKHSHRDRTARPASDYRGGTLSLIRGIRWSFTEAWTWLLQKQQRRTCQVNSHDPRDHHELNAGAQHPADFLMRRLRNIQLRRKREENC